MDKYYVYYDGWGQWGKFDHDGAFNLYEKQISINGVFQLLQKDEIKIELKDVAEVGFLDPCNHDDAIKPPQDDLLFMPQTYGENWEWNTILYKSDNVKNGILLPCDPEDNTKPISNKTSKQVDAIYKQLAILEKIANNKNLPFERSAMPCSKQMMFDWIKEKEQHLFSSTKELSSFETIWKKVKDFKCTHRTKVDSDFFNKLKS